ncbi:MAG: GTPase Era [Legionellales bacterium]|nr:MAG: GTPase Era [Legionellales bacterium]
MYSGFVGIVGRANVGKSTLLNKILGEKITITANKPQTTRENIHGIKNYPNAQAIYVDTPGLYLKSHRTMVRNINRIARGVIKELDVAVLVIDRNKWTPDDTAVLEYLAKAEIPILLVLNKYDKTSLEELLPSVTNLQAKFTFAEIIPVSAKNGYNVAKLETAIVQLLPEGEAIADSETVTNKGLQFRASEIIREKLIRLLGDELPYDCKLEMEKFEVDSTSSKKLYRIHANIVVLRSGQKAIVIGKGASRIKDIGSKARIDLEKLLGIKVFLKLQVKIAK